MKHEKVGIREGVIRKLEGESVSAIQGQAMSFSGLQIHGKGI